MYLNEKIIEFIAAEVHRQGYLGGTDEHLERCCYMGSAWMKAMEWSGDMQCYPIPSQVEWLGRLVEPVTNQRGFREYGVTVGDHIPPPAREVPRLVAQLVDLGWPELTPDQWYLEFERIHPFADGNGRVGKILHNWLSGTLEDPVLVQDFFGGGKP